MTQIESWFSDLSKISGTDCMMFVLYYVSLVIGNTNPIIRVSDICDLLCEHLLQRISILLSCLGLIYQCILIGQSMVQGQHARVAFCMHLHNNVFFCGGVIWFVFAVFLAYFLCLIFWKSVSSGTMTLCLFSQYISIGKDIFSVYVFFKNIFWISIFEHRCVVWHGVWAFFSQCILIG